MSLGTAHKVVVIGGTSGLGLATAQAIAEKGATVVVASRNPITVESALRALPPTAIGRTVDASDTAAVGAFLDEVGPFDHLVYTAGENFAATTLDDYTAEGGTRFLGLRLVHMLDVVRQAVPHLREDGSVTLTAGTAAFKGGSGWFLGAAVSGAVISAAKSLAVELAPLRVNVVAPGVVRSPLWAGMPDSDRELMYETSGRALPLGRVGEPEDIAREYVHLIEQDYATGVVSVVDGGTVLV
ncbi:SDR family oxidoreductase [Gryllotalpicola protaetiae]|uniref:SDR family oxidoreductase n=1 Tax=Gryllotalpicola protaetiae TaxID=2419771 RepID=A0A387BFC9_9MICO|nr:SDR family oxidoreductase [Gryllotalpicola protaetiae]AYG02623.1 SDR family oxidoreductase [Gryllotalpicola protaetiae]